MNILPLLALGLLPVAASAATAPDLDKIAGVYKHRFANGTVQGDNYTSEDILEVVKMSSKTAYFRIHGEFYNGHECNIWGIADLMPDALTYFGPVNLGTDPCTLKFTANAKGLMVEDVKLACQAYYCGARGSLDRKAGDEYPFSARRPIRYMARLLKSGEYTEAVKEHDAHPVGTPARDK